MQRPTIDKQLPFGTQNSHQHLCGPVTVYPQQQQFTKSMPMSKYSHSAESSSAAMNRWNAAPAIDGYRQPGPIDRGSPPGPGPSLLPRAPMPAKCQLPPRKFDVNELNCPASATTASFGVPMRPAPPGSRSTDVIQRQPQSINSSSSHFTPGLSINEKIHAEQLNQSQNRFMATSQIQRCSLADQSSAVFSDIRLPGRQQFESMSPLGQARMPLQQLQARATPTTAAAAAIGTSRATSSSCSLASINTPTQPMRFDRNLFQDPNALMEMARPYQNRAASSVIDDLEPTKKIPQTPSHSGRNSFHKTKDERPPSRAQSRASNVSRKRSQRTAQASTPEKRHLKSRDITKTLPSLHQERYYQQTESSLQNFGGHWNDFVANHIDRIKSADNEIEHQRDIIYQLEADMEELCIINDKMKSQLAHEQSRSDEAEKKNEALLNEMQRENEKMHDLQTDGQQKIAKLEALAKKMKDKLNDTIRDGQVAYAAGKDRWSGAISEAKTTSEAVASIKNCLDVEKAKVMALNRSLDDLSKDMHAMDEQREC